MIQFSFFWVTDSLYIAFVPVADRILVMVNHLPFSTYYFSLNLGLSVWKS